MNKDKFQNKYNEVFQSLKEEKMNWDFDDFLQKAEGNHEVISDKETPVISINSKEKARFPKWFWMAASFVLLFGLAAFLLVDSTPVSDREDLVKNEILKHKNDFIAENHEHQTQVAVNYTDSVSGEKRDSLFVENTIADKDELEELLSKKARMKKEIKPKYVHNSSPTDSSAYQDAYVIVNGKKITNEKEAIDIATFSFLKMRSEFRKTVASFNNEESFNEE